MRPTTPKRASGNERALKKGGAGGHPPRLFASGLSLEKAWIPARDRAGNHLAGANLRWSRQDHLPSPPAGVASFPGLDRRRSRPGKEATPAGGLGRWSCRDQRRLAPARWFPARSRAGIQAFSRESPDAKSRGGWPPAPPFFRARSFPLARFGVVGRIVPVYGLLRCPCTCPDLETFFPKNAF